MTKLSFSHHFDADLDTIFRLMSDPDTLERKYTDCGSNDVEISAHDDREGSPWTVTSRKITVDLPGFAKKVIQPTNTVVQTDDWQPADGAGARVCRYTVEVKGVPSRIDGTLTLTPDGVGTKFDVVAEVKVSIPLVGGRLEKFAAESGQQQLRAEADWTASAASAGLRE